MAVGFTEKFDEKSGDAIAANKCPKYRSWWRCPAIDDREEKEEDNALKPGFIELGGMSAFRPTMWKDHTPFDVGGSPK